MKWQKQKYLKYVQYISIAMANWWTILQWKLMITARIQKILKLTLLSSLVIIIVGLTLTTLHWSILLFRILLSIKFSFGLSSDPLPKHWTVFLSVGRAKPTEVLSNNKFKIGLRILMKVNIMLILWLSTLKEQPPTTESYWTLN